MVRASRNVNVSYVVHGLQALSAYETRTCEYWSLVLMEEVLTDHH